MAMLAEPRRRQKYSTDPRGLHWANDNDKFGQKMLESMGWKKGKGLGANENGNTEHIKVDVKQNTRGVGCSKSYADNWIAHQDDFNSLLSELSSSHQDAAPSKSGEQVMSLENKSKTSRSRVHYTKFTKGKDLSSRNKEDLACVFGKRKSKSEGNTPLVQSEDLRLQENSDTEETRAGEEPRVDKSHGITTITSPSSIAEYFALKMAQLHKSRLTENTSGAQSAEQSLKSEAEPDNCNALSAGSISNGAAENEAMAVDKPEQKERKRCKRLRGESGSAASAADDDAGIAPVKKKKKSKRSHAEKDIDEAGVAPVKESKKSKFSDAESDSDGAWIAPAKKKKKSKGLKAENGNDEAGIAAVKKKKKSKRSDVENDLAADVEIALGKKKQKASSRELGKTAGLESSDGMYSDEEDWQRCKKKKKKNTKELLAKSDDGGKGSNGSKIENKKSKKRAKEKGKTGAANSVDLPKNRKQKKEPADNGAKAGTNVPTDKKACQNQRADKDVEKILKVRSKKKKKNHDLEFRKTLGFKGSNIADIKGYAGHM